MLESLYLFIYKFIRKNLRAKKALKF